MTVKELSQKTPVQLGLVITVCTIMVGLAIKITTLEANQINHDALDDKRVEKIETELKEYRNDITEIKINVSALLNEKGKVYQKHLND